MKSCFFIGHREASEEIFSALTEAVEHHIVHCGVTEFIVGNYGGFDRMAARDVISAKALYPEISLLLLLSYHPAERPIETPPGFDGTFFPPGMESVPRRYAIVRANRYMIDHVDYLIAYLDQKEVKKRSDAASHLKRYITFKTNSVDTITDRIHFVIDHYKEHFDAVDQGERYKWEAIAWYKKHWKIDSPNFAQMLEEAFGKAKNLLPAIDFVDDENVVFALCRGKLFRLILLNQLLPMSALSLGVPIRVLKALPLTLKPKRTCSAWPLVNSPKITGPSQ